MGRIIFICCFILSPSFSARADADTTFHLTVERNIPGTYTNFYTDNLGNSEDPEIFPLTLLLILILFSNLLNAIILIIY